MLALALTGCGEKSADNAQAVTPEVVETIPAETPPLVKAAIAGNLTEIGAAGASAEIDATDALGRTPLHMAAFYGHPRTTALLISRGANIEAKDRIGMTPLHAAVISGGRREVETLIERNAEVTAKTDAGQTPLHLSAATGQPKLSQYLIAQGADPKSTDRDEETPLYYASRNGHPITTGVLKKYVSRKD